MERTLLKFSLACATGVMILTANPAPAKATETVTLAYEEGVAGFTLDNISSKTNDTSVNATVQTLNYDEIPMPGFDDIGIANVDTNLLIREKPDADAKILGKLPKDGGITVVEPNKNGWTKVKQGKLVGYAKSEYLIVGPEAAKLAKKVGDYIATSNTEGLNVRKNPSIDSEVLDSVAKGEELIVLDSLVPSYGDDHNKWVKVSLDGDDSENGTVGYVAKEYVNLSYALKEALSNDELNYGSGVSSTRISLINFAKEYLGYRYVWGGTSLKYGVDCSGFTQQVYEQYGYYLPRVSRDQARSGRTISTSNLKPGDLVFYGSNGYISHVAIYIGNGRIIHASNRRDGIKISSLYYRQPIKCARYIND